MRYQLINNAIEKILTPCIIIGIFETQQFTLAAQRIDEASDGFIASLIKEGDLTGSFGQFLILYNVPGITAKRVLVIGLGKEEDLTYTKYRNVIIKTVEVLNDIGIKEAVNTLIELPLKDYNLSARIKIAVIAAENAIYHFDSLKSQKPHLNKLELLSWNIANQDELITGERALQEALAIASGINLAKNLANLPGNICTPIYLAEQVKLLVDHYPNADLALTILDKKAIEELNMGAFLAVAKGSHEPPKFIMLHYHGAHNQQEQPIILIGKGITFDAGGISLKPGEKMDEMKFDMSGAAAVLGATKAIIELALPINLITIIPATENLPGGSAIKPGDIVTSLSGQTIEILNTDAEGRLILCDALTYAERFNPKIVIDVATLTGACVVALGKNISGLFSNQPQLTKDLISAGISSGDRVWELPIWDEYNELLKSNFADMANIGGRDGGAITAACFLSRYTKKFNWAHLDIAGTAYLSGDKKGATGRPVALLVQYLINQLH